MLNTLLLPDQACSVAYCTEAVKDENGILPQAANSSDWSPFLGKACPNYRCNCCAPLLLNQDENILDDDESQHALRLDILVR